jgi:flagellar motor switch protein FliM
MIRQSRTADNLSTDTMKQLLAAIGSQPTEDGPSAEGGQVSEHNWHQPHYFNSEQTDKLNNFTSQLAAAITGKFAHFFGSDYSVTIGATTFHFASELGDQICNTPARHLAFGTNTQHPTGCLSIPVDTATKWVSLLLGDTEPQTDPNKNFSQLEESLLLDLARTIVETLANALKDHHKFQPASAITSQLPIKLTGADETCKIIFEAKKADSQNSSQAYFIVPCSTLAPVVGKTAQTHGTISPEQLSKTIVPHLHNIPVSITVRLASTVLTLGEIANLCPNDIVLLDKAVDEPVELLIEGQTAFYARPAASADTLGVIITEPPQRRSDTPPSILKAA